MLPKGTMNEQQRAGASGDVNLVGLSKSFGSDTVVQPSTWTIPAGSFFAVLGVVRVRQERPRCG
ncbi:hypothetical protein ACU686_18360 [Yinghuangia aomiensis]